MNLRRFIPSHETAAAPSRDVQTLWQPRRRRHGVGKSHSRRRREVEVEKFKEIDAESATFGPSSQSHTP